MGMSGGGPGRPRRDFYSYLPDGTPVRHMPGGGIEVPLPPPQPLPPRVIQQPQNRRVSSQAAQSAPGSQAMRQGAQPRPVAPNRGPVGSSVAKPKVGASRRMFAPGAADQSPAIEPATGETRDEIDPGMTAQVSAAIRAGMSYENIQKYWPSRDFTLDKYNTAVENHEKYPGYKGPLVQVLRTVPNSEWNRIANGPVGAFGLSEVDSMIPLKPFLSKEHQIEFGMVREANPGWATAGGLTGEFIKGYTLGPLYENGLLHRLAPKLGEKAISAIADGTMDALTGALNADEGERLSGAVKGGVGGLFKNGVSLGGKAYVDKLELDVLHNTPWADKLVSDHLIPLAVGWGYDQGKKQFEEPYQTPTLKDVTEDQNLDGGVPAAVLQSAPSSSPLDLYHSRMSSGVGSDSSRARNPSYQTGPLSFAIPTTDQGKADFYAQLDQLRRNADAMAVGPYPNPGDAAQLVDPRPVYPTQHPYGFGAGFEPDQVASGRPYAVARQGFAAPADDQGGIVYHPRSLAAHYYDAQPGGGLYGDAGGDPRYGLSYDDGAGGYAQGGSDGFDFLSPASVHAGGWQHPADALGQGAGLLVAAPGARFGYGGAARSPVIGGIIPLGLGAASRSDGSGGGSDSVPLYSSYTGYGGAGAVDAQPAVAPVSDPSAWSPHSAVRNILAITPDDGQAAPNWLDPNTPPPQIMINVPDLSGLIR